MPTVKFYPTRCCALAQISGTNETTKEELKIYLEDMREEAKKKWTHDKRGGETTVFVITTPDEHWLEGILISLAFVKVFEFPRRNGYPKGNLSFWYLIL